MSPQLAKAVREFERIQKSIVFGWAFGLWLLFSGISRLGATGAAMNNPYATPHVSDKLSLLLGLLGFLVGLLFMIRATQLSLLLREPELLKKLQRKRDSMRGVPWWIISPFVD